jgi:hypothetical protein
MTENNIKLVVATVRGARKLTDNQLLGQQDPYVELCTSSNRKSIFRTRTYEDGGSLAAWNETHKMLCYDIADDSILIAIKNHNNVAADTTIGRVKIACEGIHNQDSWYKVYNDSGAVSGELNMAFIVRDATEEDFPPDCPPYSVDYVCPSNVVPKQVAHHLPTGYEERRMQDGRCYYVSHITKTSTWNKPSSRESATHEEDPLPAEWEEKIAADGTKYYVNKVSNIRSWRRPSTAHDHDHTDEGSLSPKSKGEIRVIPSSGNQHQWHHKFMMKPTWCDICKEFIIGITAEQQKAYKCKACGSCAHLPCVIAYPDLPCSAHKV